MPTEVKSRVNVPAHVPASLVWEADIDGFVRELDDPYLAAARLHDGPDILWATNAYRNRPAWLLTRYADIDAVYRDADHFSAREVTDFAKLLGKGWKLNPQEFDPPEHLAYRQILQPMFQPSAVYRLDDTIRELCRSLIADLAGRRSFDFVDNFARYVPTRIFLCLMDLPLERLEEFLGWEEKLIRGKTEEERVAAIQTIVAYLEECVHERRRRPGEDLISRILAARLGDQPLEHGDVMGMVAVLYTAGLDTVMGSLGWHMHRLSTEPHLQERLRQEPALIPDAVDEFCRAYGVTNNRRTVIEDITFNGVEMKAGDFVVLPTFLASRDPRRFSDPHAINIDRKHRAMTFGSGIHNCLGIHLARREMQIVLEEFLPRFPNIRPSPDAPFTFHTTGVWGVDSLPILCG